MEPQSVGDTVGDLADAVGASATAVIIVDGRTVRRDVSLSGCCVHGSRVEIAALSSARGSAPVQAASTPRALVEVSIGSGPDCTGCIPLAAGRHVVGRSPASHIRVADPQLGLHHAVIDVEEDAVTVTQLSGQAPIRLDGEPVAGTRQVSLPVRVSIGMNEVRIAVLQLGGDEAVATGSIVAAATDPWRYIVRRVPDQPIEPPADSITPPTPVEVQRTPPVMALVGAAIALLGAGLVAVLLSQTMIALLVAFFAVASATTWAVGAVSTWQGNRQSRRAGDIDRQRFLDDLAVARQAERQRHLIAHTDLGQIIAIADALAGPPPLRSNVWQRRLSGAAVRDDRDDRDGRATFHPVIGTGTSRWTPPLDGEAGPDSVTDVDCAATIDGVAIPLALACGEVVAISGGPTEREALLRAIVCQMAVRHGPADWQLVVVSADRQKWAWAGWLPHAQSATGTILIADPGDSERLVTVLALAAGRAPRPTLLVVDDAALFAVSASALGRFVERVQPATLTTIEAGSPMPAGCSAAVEVGSTGAVMTTRLDGSAGGVADAASSISMCGLSMERAASIARAIAKLTDPG